ncbi:MAG TPA: dTDP-4-dehydrorhamnose reductase [Acidobacteriaceae bacterium]|nr:dTDP-4-dehydrorhamnose reductase [Acidobacteriaceae bacterium]
MSPRILLVGSGGQVGRELQRSFAGLGELVACDRQALDLTSENSVRAVVERTEPDVILNAAAYTAVDKAESEADLAHAINARAPQILAEEAARRGALLIHYSTDYVFDGSKTSPWTETDEPHPLNIYGASKLAGEEAIRRVGGRYLIFRTSWVYGPHGKNFLFTMLRLGRERERLIIVDDQRGAPTTSIAIADATRAIAEGVLAGRFGATEDWAGLYHMTCGGVASWFEFGQAIFARAGRLLDGRLPQVAPIATADYPTPARRPLNSVLCCEKLARIFDVRLPDWEAALDTVLRQL